MILTAEAKLGATSQNLSRFSFLLSGNDKNCPAHCASLLAEILGGQGCQLINSTLQTEKRRRTSLLAVLQPHLYHRLPQSSGPTVLAFGPSLNQAQPHVQAFALAVSPPWNVLSLLYLHGLQEAIGFSWQAGLTANLLSEWPYGDTSEGGPAPGCPLTVICGP